MKETLLEPGVVFAWEDRLLSYLVSSSVDELNGYRTLCARLQVGRLVECDVVDGANKIGTVTLTQCNVRPIASSLTYKSKGDTSTPSTDPTCCSKPMTISQSPWDCDGNPVKPGSDYVCHVCGKRTPVAEVEAARGTKTATGQFRGQRAGAVIGDEVGSYPGIVTSAGMRIVQVASGRALDSWGKLCGIDRDGRPDEDYRPLVVDALAKFGAP